MKLPKTIYVRIENPDNDEPYLVASEEVEIEGDGPTDVGVYVLSERRIVRKLLDQTTKR